MCERVCVCMSVSVCSVQSALPGSGPLTEVTFMCLLDCKYLLITLVQYL